MWVGENRNLLSSWVNRFSTQSLTDRFVVVGPRFYLSLAASGAWW
jgi:hypothetical protein